MSLDNAVKLFSLKPNNPSYSIGIKWGETQYKLGLWIKSEMKAKNHFELLNVSFGLQNSAKRNNISLRKQVAGFKIKTINQIYLVTLLAAGTCFLRPCNSLQACLWKPCRTAWFRIRRLLMDSWVHYVLAISSLPSH